MVRVDRLEVEPATIAEPAPVDGVGVDALIAQKLVTARLDDRAAPHRTGSTCRLALGQIPWTSLETVRLRGECAHWANLNHVAGEVRDERLVGERHHLGVVSTADEMDQRVTGYFVGEARTPVAKDAPLAIEINEVADRNRLLIVALLLDVTTLAWSVAERLILKRALATLVADWAVEWMIGQQQLNHAFLGTLDFIGCSTNDLVFGYGRHT